MKQQEKTYEAPVLIEYGDVQELTAASAPVATADVTIPAGAPLTSS